MSALLSRPLRRLFERRHRAELDAFAGVPGPEPIWPLGNALALAGGDGAHRTFEGWRERYGDVVRFWLFDQPSLLVNDPAMLREILVERTEDWHKNVPRAATQPVMGRSVFRSPGGEDWRRKRRAHPFERELAERWYEASLPVVREVTLERLRRSRGPVDLYRELLRASFEAFARTILGAAPGARWLEDAFTEHETLLREISRRGALPRPFSWSPVFWWRRARWMRRIEERLASAPAPGATDLISMVLANGGAELGAEQLRDELSNVFSAGMKNVAICAAGVLYELTRHPRWLEPVRDEASALVAGGPLPAAVRAAPALARATRESMRVHPVVPGFVREVRPGREVSLGGLRLPPRTQVFITVWTIHRHPELWPEPERFDPDRFRTEPAPGTYFPFGMGRRQCVGAELTLLFAKTMVATALDAFALELDEGVTFDTELSAGTAPPRRPIAARLHPRGS